MCVQIVRNKDDDDDCGPSESELCPVGFLVVCERSSVLLQSIVMSYVDCGDDG